VVGVGVWGVQAAAKMTKKSRMKLNLRVVFMMVSEPIY
jgi:hypothetical protein